MAAPDSFTPAWFAVAGALLGGAVTGGATYLAASGAPGSHLPLWPVVLFGVMLAAVFYLLLALSWDWPLPGRRRHKWKEDHEVTVVGNSPMQQSYVQRSDAGRMRDALESAYRTEVKQTRKERWDRLLGRKR